MANRIAIGWLLDIFLPETKPVADEARILILDGHGSHISIDFLWHCKQNNVQLVFLPPHSSHVLQPLDLSCFSIAKSKYRGKIAELAALDDSAPVKKKRFVYCYNLARTEALSGRVIRAGWKASGIFPWNPEKAIQSSQVAQATKIPITPPRPIRQAALTSPEPFQTPKSSQQMYQLTQTLQKSQSLHRSVRNVLAKAGKAIELANITQARQEAIIQRQGAELEILAPQKPRKKITVDPNTAFASIDQIKAAQIESERIAAETIAKKPWFNAKKEADKIAQLALQDMCTEWQL
jgi:hypothetical protein